MKKIAERLIRQVNVGDEINLIVSGKEFADALIEKIDDDFLIIRDKFINGFKNNSNYLKYFY